MFPERTRSAQYSAARRPSASARGFLSAVFTGAVTLLTGCTANSLRVAPTATSLRLAGLVHGGQQPVTGATIQLYAAGGTGDGSAATPLLSGPVLTNAQGVFDTGPYTCPLPSTPVYLTSVAGNPGIAEGTYNPQIVEMAALGSCQSSLTMSYVEINEVTTVAAAFALAPFTKSYNAIGSGMADMPALVNAFTTASELADPTTGRSPGVNVPRGHVVPSTKLITLADIVAVCVNSTGGRAGDLSPCGSLLSLTAPGGSSAPTDTAAAMLNLARAPTTNVLPIFLLGPPNGPFQPTLSSVPEDWNLLISSPVPTPVISPASETTSGPVTVTLSDATASTTIFYTIDGSRPTASSVPYTGPFTVAGTLTVQAVAIVSGSSSLPAASTYTVASVPSDQLVFLTQPSAVLAGSGITPSPVLAFEKADGVLDTAANGLIALQLGANPGHGSLSGVLAVRATNGTAVFPGLSITGPGSGYTLVASSVGAATAFSNSFNVMSPALNINMPSSTLGVGSTVAATLTLSTPAAGPVRVALASASPGFARVGASVVVLQPGQTSATFTYSGVAVGTSALSAAAAGYSQANANVTIVPAPTTLREAAAQRGFLMGAAVDADEFGYFDPLTHEPAYGATLGSQFNMLEGENAMKWIVTQPTQSTYNFEPGDELVTFAQAHAMKVRGHNLAWDRFNPAWLTTLANTATPAALSQLLQAHIQTEMTHYKGQVFAWDVVNEAIDDNATGVGTQMKDSVWYNQPGIGLSGTGYVEQAFRWAHAVDPEALLFYNDYLIITPGPKFQAALNMMTDFVHRGVPINGIGLQVHTDTNGWPSTAGLAQVVKAFTDLGLQVHLSETDVAVPVNAPSTSGTATANALQSQAATYGRVLTVCLQNPGCTAFQTWGFTDKYSWVPANTPGLGAALPFDNSYNPKAAFFSILNGLETVTPP